MAWTGPSNTPSVGSVANAASVASGNVSINLNDSAFVLAFLGSTGRSLSFTSNLGLTYTQKLNVFSTKLGSQMYVLISPVVNTSGTESVTATLSSGTGEIHCHLMSFAGGDSAGATDGSNSGEGTSTTYEPGSFATVSTGALIFGMEAQGATANPLTASGYTRQTNSSPNNNTAVETKIATGAATEDPNWPGNTNVVFQALGIAFKPAAGGGAASVVTPRSLALLGLGV